MNKIVLSVAILLLMACGKSDEKKILGKWQSDDVWYEYREDHTYNSGRSIITMVRGFKYSIDIKRQQLTMYTDDASQTYYLQYRFIGDDTLQLNNVLNEKPHFETFYRTGTKDNNPLNKDDQ